MLPIYDKLYFSAGRHPVFFDGVNGLFDKNHLQRFIDLRIGKIFNEIRNSYKINTYKELSLSAFGGSFNPTLESSSIKRKSFPFNWEALKTENSFSIHKIILEKI